MFSSLTAGIIFGLSAGLTPGPLLALLVAQTLKHNTREGIKVAIAPLMTDLPIILVSFFVLSRLANTKFFLGIISLVGGMYVFYLSYETFRTKHFNPGEAEGEPRSLRKAWLVNTLNPHPYLFWLTVGVPVVSKAYQENPISLLVFVMGFYVMLVGSKISLALAVGKSRSFLMSRGYVLGMRVLALLLAVFAILLLKDGMTLLGMLP